MRKLVFFAMATLDGFIAGPDHELTWVTVDEELHSFINDRERTKGAYLYGRRMYELMAGAWPTADADPAAPGYIADFARIWRAKPKIVFSKTLERVEWNSRLVPGDNIADEIAALKAQPGNDLEVGGATLASTLMRLGLIDEYELYIHPVVLGRGTPLFPSLDHKLDLRLIDTHTFGSGVVFLHYGCAGSE